MSMIHSDTEIRLHLLCTYTKWFTKERRLHFMSPTPVVLAVCFTLEQLLGIKYSSKKNCRCKHIYAIVTFIIFKCDKNDKINHFIYKMLLYWIILFIKPENLRQMLRYIKRDCSCILCQQTT